MILIKTAAGYLAPGDEEAVERLKKIKAGSLVHAEVRVPRNYQFLKKYFCLINVTFDYWEPPITEYKGIQAAKDKDRFREDITVMAGYYDVVVNIKGETRVKAKSISFAEMDEVAFGQLYSAVFDVCWKMVMSKVDGMTRGKVEEAVSRLANYE